jgi:hypothetical protein
MLLAAALGVPAQAQTSSSANQGPITFSGNFDVPTVYFFRGILQEGDPALTMWPSGDVRIALKSGSGALRSVAVNIGLWNSLHTGSSGTGGPLDKLHYQEDFSAGLDLGFGRGVGVRTSYIARTSPNNSFETIPELDIKVSKDGRIAPYGIVAFELSATGQADGGSKRGTYLELGVAPSFALPFGGARVTAPAKIGVSMRDYYELLAADLTYHDSPFGFLSVGGFVTIPLSRPGSRYGVWNAHGGAELLELGDTTQAFNQDSKTKVIGLVGIGVTY